MKKRLLSVFLCICLVLGLVPVTARAAEPTTVTTAQELESTMEAGGEIKLGVDIAVSRPLGVEDGKEVTLDLNGHAITSTGSFTLLSVGQSGSSGTTTGKLTVTDSSTGTPRGSITGQGKLFHVGQGSELSLGGGIILTSNNANDRTAPALQNEFGTVNVLEGGFTITSQMNNAIYNHGGAFNGNNISFSASTGSSGNGAALKLAIGTVIGLNASVINDRSKPAVEVESGSVEITGGSYPANGSPDGALYVGGTVTLKGGTFSNTSFLSKAISVGTNITYASLLEKGCGYTADNGTTFLTDETALEAATSLTVMAVPAPSAHTHAVSVGCETDSGTQVAFQPLPNMSASNSSGYTLAGGSYYLTANAAVGGSLTINGNVTLCLNGYTLSFSGGTEIEGNASAAISVPRGSSLSVCDCGQSKGKIAYQAGGPRGHAAIGGAGDVTLRGCAVEISKTSDYVANGLYNAGGIFTLYDSHVSATHTISGSDKTPFATAIDGRPGSTTFIHGGSLSATVRNGTAYTDGNSGAYGLNLNNGSTAYLLGRPTITASNDTGTNNFAGVYVPSSSAQLWLSKDGEAYSGNALTIKVSKHNYSEGGTVVLGVGENGDMVLDRTQEGWWEFMPANLVDERGLSSLQVTHLFGVQLNILQSGLLLYLLLALAMAGLCWLGWRRNAAGIP